MWYSRAGDYPRGQQILYAESFSPNTPQGACPKCHGLGRTYEVTEKSLVPGLHPADVVTLTAQLDGLVESGNTVIVVEHDMSVVAASDWVIDIRPKRGGRGRSRCRLGPPAILARA